MINDLHYPVWLDSHGIGHKIERLYNKKGGTMLLLARLAGVAIFLWFYFTAKQKGEPPFKWAILGFIGYWLTWWLVNLTLIKSLATAIPSNHMMAFLVSQIPAIVGILACFFIRKKLSADADATKVEKN